MKIGKAKMGKEEVKKDELTLLFDRKIAGLCLL